MIRKPGFTLIELLVVVAVLALLVGILVPSLTRARDLARRAGCASHLHGVGVGFRMYLNDSNDVMPIAAQMPSLALNDDPRIADVLASYLSAAESLFCPADPEQTFFLREGCSYEYHSNLGGREVSDSFLTKRWGEARTPVMNDYEPFHGEPGKPGAMNYLFADLHVGDLE